MSCVEINIGHSAQKWSDYVTIYMNINNQNSEM